MRRILILLKNIFMMPVKIFSHVSLFAILQEADVDKRAAISFGVRFYRGKLGKYSYIGENSFVNNTMIGNFTSIASNCYIGGAFHPVNWVSTSPVFHKWENVLKKNFARHEFEIFQNTTIGNDVWIGYDVKIKAGVNIQDGAVIGMGSVVTKDIGPYEIWAGNPARMIRKRFDDGTINELMNVKWWNWEDDKIETFADDFCDPQNIIRKCGKSNESSTFMSR